MFTWPTGKVSGTGDTLEGLVNFGLWATSGLPLLRIPQADIHFFKELKESKEAYL